jgi:hypothetical protein
MLITYKKAKAKFVACDDKWNGAKFYSYKILLVEDRVVFKHRGTPIFAINENNDYEFLVNDKQIKSYIKFLSKYTPLRLKLKKKQYQCGLMPYYKNIKVNKAGDFLIPDVWPPHHHNLECEDCGQTYTTEVCGDCLVDRREYD